MKSLHALAWLAVGLAGFSTFFFTPDSAIKARIPHQVASALIGGDPPVVWYNDSECVQAPQCWILGTTCTGPNETCPAEGSSIYSNRNECKSNPAIVGRHISCSNTGWDVCVKSHTCKTTEEGCFPDFYYFTGYNFTDCRTQTA